MDPELGVHRIQNFAIRSDPDLNLNYSDNRGNYSFCTTTGKAGMTVYPVL